MPPDQLQTFLEHNRRDTTEVIERVVNGKIRDLTTLVEAHNTSHENDMLAVRTHIQAVTPIVIEYQERQAARAFAKRYGDTVKWSAGLLTAVGVLWLAFKSLLK